MDTSQASSGVVEAQLARMLDSETFRGAERSRSLLRFIVEETLRGRADRLKDYTLGAEGLGRGDGFDPRTDPIARVEASRLRSRLNLYYATEGATDPVRISLPKGGYTPVFEARPPATTSLPFPQTGQGGLSQRPSGPGDRSRTGARLLAGTGGVLVLTVILAVWLATRVAPDVAEAPVMHLDLTTPATTDPGSLAISPDGLAIVFVGSREGHSRLWLRRLESSAPRQLIGTEHASLPFWAPHGRSVGFFADGRIKSLDLDTGLVRVISTALVPAGGTWNSGDVILYTVIPDGPLFRTTAAGAVAEAVTQLAPGHTGHRAPVFLPDGRHFLFYVMGSRDVRGVYVGELGTAVVRRLIEADTPAAVAPPDHILYAQHSTLVAQRIDPETVSLVGNPVPLAEGITADPIAGIAAFTASARTIAYRAGPSTVKRQFVWVDRRGNEISRIGAPGAFGPSYASASPNGRRLAVQRSVDGNMDIVLVDAEDRASRFTTEPQADIAPRWSPTGDRIVYASQKDDAFQLFEKALDGTPARLLLSSRVSKQATDWSPDERYLLFRTVAFTPKPDMDIWALPLEGDRTPLAVVQTPFEERDAQFSPDGRWIAYQSNESGQYEVYVKPFQRKGERVPISTGGGVQARWRSDGRELFYLTLDGQLVAVPMAVRADGSPQPGPAVALFRTNIGSVQGIALHGYIVAPGGQRFLMDTLIEQAPPPMSIVLNWKSPVARN